MIRKLLCQLLLLVVLAASARAQQPAARPLPPVPDSLKAVMARATTSLLRMKALERVSLAYAARYDSTGTLTYARALGELARQQRSPYYEGDALAIQSQFYFTLKLLPKALRLSEQALPLRTGAQLADTQRKLGTIYDKLHQTSRALALLRTAQRTYRAAHLPKSVCMVDTDLGLLYLNQEQLDSAEFYLLRAARGYRALPGEGLREASALGNLAALQYRRRQYAAQNHYSRQALALHQTLHDSTNLGTVYNSLCVAAMNLDSLPQAIRYGRQALRLNRRFRRLDGEQSALNNIGSCFSKRNQPDSAAAYFRLALASTRQGGVPSMQGQYLFKLAQATNAAHQPAEALRLALKVEALDSVHRNEATTILNLGLLAKLGQARHDDAAALGYFQRQRALEQRLAASSSSKEIAALRVRFDAERTEQQLALATARAATEAQRANAEAQRAATLRLLGQQHEAAYRDTLSRREQQRLTQQLQAAWQASRAERATQQLRTLSQQSREQAQQARLGEQAARLRVQQQELAMLRTRQQLWGVGAAAGLGLLLVGGLFWQYRRRQARAVEAREASLRLRLAADLHDDVGNLLTQINLQSGLLNEYRHYPPEQVAARLDTLAATARRAARQMTDVVWGLNNSQHTLPDLLLHMRDHAQEVLTPAEVDVEFITDADLVQASPSAEVRHQLYLIFKESLHNVVKHARATLVTVRLRYEAGQLLLLVQDDGSGYTGVGRPGGHGLANMQARAQAVGGQVAYAPRNPGFEVQVMLPA